MVYFSRNSYSLFRCELHCFLGTALGITGYFFQVVLNKEQTAISFYEKALKHNTKSGYALAAYGLILLKEGQNEKALSLFEKLHMIDPSIMIEKLPIPIKLFVYGK